MGRVGLVLRMLSSFEEDIMACNSSQRWHPTDLFVRCITTRKVDMGRDKLKEGLYVDAMCTVMRRYKNI